MCGISGLYSPDRRWGLPELERVTRALSHRGPDAEGFFQDGERGFFLGHRRLSILDLSSAANQPMVSADGRWAMVYNGEVYNYAELAAELRFTPTTRSDTEVMLEAIRREGPAAARRFNGMFALALYDREQGELHLLRDPVGIKPLVYYADGTRLAFASELKALLALDIPREINPQALDDYLHYEYVPGPQSIFQRIYKLPPGCHLTLRRGEPPIVNLYARLHERIRRPVEPHTDAQWLERFETTLQASLRRQRVADVPVGAFLSGGTDSSLVTLAYQQVSEQPVRTFTIGFDEREFDETRYAEAVAQQIGTMHQTLPLPAGSGLSEVARIADHYDEPFAVPSVIPSLAVCRLARSQVKVALAGDGGDELFMGYGTYAWQRRLARLQRLGPAGLSAAAALMKAAATVGGDRYRRIARVFGASAGPTHWLDVWSEEQYLFNPAEITRLRRRPYVHATLLPAWEEISSLGLDPWEAVALFDLTQYLAHDLMYKMDIAAMAVGLEVRVPLLDLELIDLSLNLPLHLRRSGSHAKVLMKRVLERHLPHELVHRRKWGFPAPVKTWLRGPLAPMIDRYLAPRALDRHGLFDTREVQRLVAQFRQGHDHHYKRVWALITFQQWAERYLDADLTR